MTIGIYCIEHIESGKKYIGKSIDVNTRLRKHKLLLTNEEFSSDRVNRHLWHAVQKYGWSAFKCYVVEELPNDTNLAEREIYWMDHFNTLDRTFGYNIVRDSPEYVSVADETRDRLAKVWLGRKHKPETIAKMKEVWQTEARRKLGKIQKHTEEHKHNLSLQMSGEGNSFYGKTHSDESLDKMSAWQSHNYYEQYTLEGNLVRIWSSRRELELAGFISTSIRKVCRGEQKTHRGFVWKRTPKK